MEQAECVIYLFFLNHETKQPRQACNIPSLGHEAKEARYAATMPRSLRQEAKKAW